MRMFSNQIAFDLTLDVSFHSPDPELFEDGVLGILFFFFDRPFLVFLFINFLWEYHKRCFVFIDIFLCFILCRACSYAVNLFILKFWMLLITSCLRLLNSSIKFLVNRAQLEFFNNRYANLVFRLIVGAPYVLSVLSVIFHLEKIFSTIMLLRIMDNNRIEHYNLLVALLWSLFFVLCCDYQPFLSWMVGCPWFC